MKRFSIVVALTALVSGLGLLELAPVAADDAACGEKGQPMCPLQEWMEKHMQPPFDDKDFKKLSASLKKAASFAPDPKWNDGDKGWKKLAEDGAAAAEAGDLKAVQASCKSCHKAWRKQYRKDHRKQPIR
jgi:cytochrome c556